MIPVSVTGDPFWGAAVRIVRLFMRDVPHLNRLIVGEESNDRMIAWAIADTLDDFNVSPPLLQQQFSLEWFIPNPDMAQRNSFSSNGSGFSLIRFGAVANLLESVNILQVRNELDFRDGDVTTVTSRRYPQLSGLVSYYRNLYESKKDKYKVALNIDRAIGSSATHSAYWAINGYYGKLGNESVV